MTHLMLTVRDKHFRRGAVAAAAAGLDAGAVKALLAWRRLLRRPALVA